MPTIERLDTSDEPIDRLTHLCKVATDAIEADPLHEPGDNFIIFADGDQESGLQVHGWTDLTEATAALLMHLQAMFAARGASLTLGFVDDDGNMRTTP